MKTQLFWQYYEEQRHNEHHTDDPTATCDYQKVLRITRSIFEKLAIAYQRRLLEDFWVTDHNLLLAYKYGSHGWCASNYARILRWMLEPVDSDNTPHLITAADCEPGKKSHAGI